MIIFKSVFVIKSKQNKQLRSVVFGNLEWFA
jgi:hypothetical protein